MAHRDDPTVTSGPTLDPAYEETAESPGATPVTGPVVTATGLDGTLPVGARIGRFVVGEVIGSGGMGVVYQARDPDLDRDLAIKVVQPSVAGARAQQRLVEEARAMAKLRHPSVMPVFDVGTFESGVYVVMPLVTGGTMHDWLHAERRPWRAVLERFIASGRGLAAAHAAGLIHRDFKPRNVILGSGGEVLVADFGIAAQTGHSSDDTVDLPFPATQVSSVAGTPAYMAPEQAQGDAIDARADQFSFCVSLWEGLHGERPGQAETRRAGRSDDNVPEIPDDRRGAPSWLLQAVARGFSTARERRWPSMTALLGHIEQRLRRPRRLVLGAGAVTVAGVAAGLALMVPPGSQGERGPAPCPDPVERMEAVWGAARRARVEQAFGASGSPVAADTLARIVPVLDAYAAQWRVAHVESCRATHVAHTQSAEMLDKRSVCLDRRLAALSALAEALATADAAFVPKAISLPAQLPSIADCESNDALLGQQALPTDPAVRERIAALEARLDEQDALLVKGNQTKVLEEARRLVVEVKAIDYLPTQARAQYLLVKALSVMRAELEPEVRELAALAARAKDDVISAYAWGRLIQELVQKGRMDEARQLVPVAEAAVERADRAPQIAFSLYMTLGGHAGNTGDLEGATAYFEKAMKIADDSGREDLRAGALRNLAYSLYVRGQRDKARELIAESVALTAKMVGTNHPRYADVLDYQGSILAGGDAEDTDRAIAAVAESLRIRIASYGENHPAVAENLSTLALLVFNRDRFDEAEAYIDRALAILEKVPAPLTLPGALTTKADVVFARRDVAAARPYYERALKAAAEAAGEKSIDYTNIEITYAERLIDEGDCRRGRELANHAQKVLVDSGSPTRSGALLQLARCDQKEGKHGAAIARLEEHVKFCAEAGCEPMGTAIGIRELGRELVETGRDRTRGYQLVYEALDRFRKLDATRSIDGSEEWLKAHPQ